MIIFDVSGVDGASGTSGKSFSHSTAHLDARRGGHGTDGQAGTTAGDIAVRLTTPTTTANIPKNVVLAKPIDTDVRLRASIINSSKQKEKTDAIWTINSGKLMCFHALGGHGGNGGDGGDGGNGGGGKCGKRGGERGGDGGDGGYAGKGGDGGSGGTIRISVPKADTYLLMLHGNSEYSAGRGGSAGKQGIGGQYFQGYLTASFI